MAALVSSELSGPPRWPTFNMADRQDGRLEAGSDIRAATLTVVMSHPAAILNPVMSPPAALLKEVMSEEAAILKQVTSQPAAILIPMTSEECASGLAAILDPVMSEEAAILNAVTSDLAAILNPVTSDPAAILPQPHLSAFLFAPPPAAILLPATSGHLGSRRHRMWRPSWLQQPSHPAAILNRTTTPP
ncbi:hypothetical protein LUU34_01651400 [Aix galericulata]|nr:hypothetical protein LUU34_01651400 [Aix galericulata]